MRKFLGLSFLLTMFAWSAPSWAYSEYVCMVDDGVWKYFTRGPTAASAAGYAERLCQGYGLSAECAPLREALCQAVSPAPTRPVGIAFLDAVNIATGVQKTTLSRPAPRRTPRPAPSRGGGNDSDWVNRAPPGRCVALNPSDQMGCDIDGQTFAAVAFCGSNRRCIWIPR